MSPVSQYFILSNSEYWSQTWIQNVNIHSIKLDVYDEYTFRKDVSSLEGTKKKFKERLHNIRNEV